MQSVDLIKDASYSGASQDFETCFKSEANRNAEADEREKEQSILLDTVPFKSIQLPTASHAYGGSDMCKEPPPYSHLPNYRPSLSKTCSYSSQKTSLLW